MSKRMARSAADIMTTDIVSVEEHQSIRSASEALELLRFRHVPVTDGDRLLGLVSQRDLLRVGASSALPNSESQSSFLAGIIRVKDIMSTELRTVGPDTPLHEVAMLMHKEKLGCVPVIEGTNTLVGLITEADIVALAAVILQNE